MKKLIAFSTLLVAAAPAFSAPNFNTVPEPSMLPLLGLGALGIILAKRLKK